MRSRQRLRRCGSNVRTDGALHRYLRERRSVSVERADLRFQSFVRGVHANVGLCAGAGLQPLDRKMRRLYGQHPVSSHPPALRPVHERLRQVFELRRLQRARVVRLQRERRLHRRIASNAPRSDRCRVRSVAERSFARVRPHRDSTLPRPRAGNRWASGPFHRVEPPGKRGTDSFRIRSK